MKLDRALQSAVLFHLKEFYPQFSREVAGEPFVKSEDFYGNLVYLSEHGLIELELSTKKANSIARARITHEGLDFLEQDGGISQVLRTVPVKILDAHDFISRLEKMVANADIFEPDRRSILDRLKVFSTPVLQHILTDLLKQLLG